MSPIQPTAAALIALVLNGLTAGASFGAGFLVAGRGPGTDAQQAIVLSIRRLPTPGLMLAKAVLQYADGDRLSGEFRVDCPTRMIRPVNYELIAASGVVRKRGSWWEPAFQPRWRTEHDLVGYVCRVGAF